MSCWGQACKVHRMVTGPHKIGHYSAENLSKQQISIYIFITLRLT